MCIVVQNYLSQYCQDQRYVVHTLDPEFGRSYLGQLSTLGLIWDQISKTIEPVTQNVYWT